MAPHADIQVLRSDDRHASLALRAYPPYGYHQNREIMEEPSTGRQSSLSLRSLPYGPEGLDLDGGGAEIPDIPLRRSRPSPTSAGAGHSHTGSYATFEDVITSNGFVKPFHGPVNPNKVRANADKMSTVSDETVDLMVNQIPIQRDELESFESRPPSRYARSVRSSRSRADSEHSFYQVSGTALPALQTKGASDDDALEPLPEEEIDPGSFDLVVPVQNESGVYSLERRSELLFSREHLKMILADAMLLQRFTGFLFTFRPASIPLLVYYLDALKALKAVAYANSIINSLGPLNGHEFSALPSGQTSNESLYKKAEAALDALAQQDLPAYITHVWIQTVNVSIRRRITGTLPPHLREMSEGLAEVFCLTDPSRRDNPIVFASEEFHRTTQYGMNYVIGRNCRFLQGPKTNPFSTRRIREKIESGKPHYETFLNYRRDGSPFMNLLMCAPLYDSRGKIRYFIGAQVDVSGLAKECSGLPSLSRLIAERETANDDVPKQDECTKGGAVQKDEFREMSEMFNLDELETIRCHGGSLHRPRVEEQQANGTESNWYRPRILIQDEVGNADTEPPSPAATSIAEAESSGRLSGIYENYLLVRPAPSLRILFASPSLRVPGMLQSNFLSRIGGSTRVQEELGAALAHGHGVTARVRWVANPKTTKPSEGRPRWIHCTPLQGSNGAIGVWMVVIVDDEDDGTHRSRRPFREAPPVETPRPWDRKGRWHARRPAMDDSISLGSFANYISSEDLPRTNGHGTNGPFNHRPWGHLESGPSRRGGGFEVDDGASIVADTP